MYELKVKDKEGVWHNLDLMPNEEPAMTYQVNDIAELKDRQADYSQKIKLPKTALNTRVLERVDIFEADSPIPYELFECRLYSNGLTLAGRGSLFVIDSVSDYIEGQIISGNADLFYTMQKRLIEEADLGSVIVGEARFPLWVKNAMAVIGKQFEENKSEGHYFFNVYELVNRLVSLCGYSLQTNLPLLTRLKDFYSLPSLLPSADSLDMFDSKASYRVIGDVSIPNILRAETRYLLATINNNGLGTLTYVGTQAIGDNPYRLKFMPNINGKIRIGIRVTGSKIFDVNAFYSIQCYVSNGSEGVYSRREPYLSYSYDIDDSVEVEVEKDKAVYLSLRVIRKSDSYTINEDICEMLLQGSYTITEIEADQVPVGGRLYFANNTGFKTYLDLFKVFCQTYGLTCMVDNTSKVVRAYTMDRLYENKTNAKDFSDSLSRENTDMSFTIDGYGQNNFIRFEKEGDFEDWGNFFVQNENLEKWKDIFTIKWGSGKDVRKGEYDLAYIPLYEYDDEVANKRKFVKGKPHLVEINRVNYNPFFIANHIPAQRLVDNYYDKLANNMLVRAKCLSVELLLTERDIEDLDFFTPIYLKQFGAYFYISKISNFVNSGRLTKVELVRM